MYYLLSSRPHTQIGSYTHPMIWKTRILVKNMLCDTIVAENITCIEISRIEKESKSTLIWFSVENQKGRFFVTPCICRTGYIRNAAGISFIKGFRKITATFGRETYPRMNTRHPYISRTEILRRIDW